MTKKTEEVVAEPEHKPRKDMQVVLDMAERIEKNLAIDAKTGQGSEKTSVYEENIPEDLSLDVINKVGDFNATFIAAGAYAFGKMAVDAMSSNKKLEAATVEIKMGDKDSVSYNVDRCKTFTNRLSGNGEEVKKFGVITTSYDVRGGKNAGQLKNARKLVAEIASSKLK